MIIQRISPANSDKKYMHLLSYNACIDVKSRSPITEYVVGAPPIQTPEEVSIFSTTKITKAVISEVM